MKKIFLETYSKKNLGDDLFLCMIAKRYPKIIFDVATKEENIKKLGLKNVRGFGLLRRMINKVVAKVRGTGINANKKYLAKIILGGSMFIEQTKTKQQLDDFIDKYYLRNELPLFVLGANFGPYENQFYLEDYKKVFEKAEDVCFREEYSKELFRDLKNVRVAPDIVFGFDAEKYNSIKQEKKVLISVINLENRKGLKVNLENYESKIARIADYYAKNGYEVVLMSFCKNEGDEIAIERILGMVNEANIYPYCYDGDIDKALTEIASSEIIIGTRFHSIVLGLALNKKVVPIIYSNKTRNMLQDLGYEGEMIEVENINFNNIDSYIVKKNISRERKTSENHFRELDKFIKERA